ncbi:uncharacterized protein CC84DRAFT_1176191 [Paraphaeosphaeria sporulosa]|uniref:Uncharacterized protein n=1 Tax=Paraphaeosphaeria sporulosa TaxID=1460663 RepID=A0A177CH05_9PLEO|nr:uncharacterized protein CC84DRAFT_1176191 [Paraphaeosphaeria sporulosa]OAG06138.1 hypothetical protein CC84DRAFT_1176191 [Paraphaeosphaeria sporulosa]
MDRACCKRSGMCISVGASVQAPRPMLVAGGLRLPGRTRWCSSLHAAGLCGPQIREPDDGQMLEPQVTVAVSAGHRRAVVAAEQCKRQQFQHKHVPALRATHVATASPLRSLLAAGVRQGRGRSNGAEAGGRTERQIAITSGPWTGRAEVGEVKAWRPLRARPARSPDWVARRPAATARAALPADEQHLRRSCAQLSSSSARSPLAASLRTVWRAAAALGHDKTPVWQAAQPHVPSGLHAGHWPRPRCAAEAASQHALDSRIHVAHTHASPSPSPSPVQLSAAARGGPQRRSPTCSTAARQLHQRLREASCQAATDN